MKLGQKFRVPGKKSIYEITSEGEFLAEGKSSRGSISLTKNIHSSIVYASKGSKTFGKVKFL